MAEQTPQQVTTVSVTADASASHWVYRFAPRAVQPYLKLARLDRPVGVWLLLWPCWWSSLMAAGTVDGFGAIDARHLVLFAIGALAMRGAGCTYNDIVDNRIDAQVARTATRPIPAGEISVIKAWLFLVFQCLIGLGVLLQFNDFTVFLGLGSLLLVAAYPFMKRITWWPQLWLGLTFNWGALVGYAALIGRLDASAFALYAGAVGWTLGYDTIYAHQDREDDALIGVKSTARKLGHATKVWLLFFYGIFIMGLAAANWLASGGLFFYGVASIAALHLMWQVGKLDIDDGDSCLALFKSNIGLGGLVTLGFLLALM